MRQARVLVVYKKDAYQQCLKEQRDPHLRRLLSRRHPEVLDMRAAHLVHQRAIARVVQELRELDVDYDMAYRVGLQITKGYDLVVSVGGDGTFLQAARSVPRTPLLGVNSDPSRSEAVFCAATPRTFGRMCRLALRGRLSSLRLSRLQLTLNGERISHRALNDVLVVHDDPATMSRYRLQVGRRVEVQKSSGLWISTAAGSSSAIFAAGGAALPWGSARFQYRPRELYYGRLSHPQLRGGILRTDLSVRVTWLMRRGSVFLDGPHVRIPLRFADRLEVGLSLRDPLRVLGLSQGEGRRR